MYMIKIEILFLIFKENESIQSTMNKMIVLESMVKGSFSNYSIIVFFCSQILTMNNYSSLDGLH